MSNLRTVQHNDSKGLKTYQLAEERRRADIRGPVIPGENHRIWIFDVVPQRVPFLERDSKHSDNHQLTLLNGKGHNTNKDGSCPDLHPSPEVLKNGRDDGVLLRLLDLLPGWPDITEIHLLPLGGHTCTTGCFMLPSHFYNHHLL